MRLRRFKNPLLIRILSRGRDQILKKTRKPSSTIIRKSLSKNNRIYLISRNYMGSNPSMTLPTTNYRYTPPLWVEISFGIHNI